MANTKSTKPGDQAATTAPTPGSQPAVADGSKPGDQAASAHSTDGSAVGASALATTDPDVGNSPVVPVKPADPDVPLDEPAKETAVDVSPDLADAVELADYKGITVQDENTAEVDGAVPPWIRQNYTDMVRLGQASWSDIAKLGEAEGSAELAAFARSQARAGAPSAARGADQAQTVQR